MRDRREEHDPRWLDAVILLTAGVVDECRHLLLEGVEAGRARVRLVGTEEGENHVGLRAHEFEAVLADVIPGLEFVRPRDRSDAGQPLVGGAEIGAAEPLHRVDLVAVVAEVADHEPVPGEPGMEQRLQPAGVLHGVGDAAADDADVVALLEGEDVGTGRRQAEPENHEKTAKNRAQHA